MIRAPRRALPIRSATSSSPAAPRVTPRAAGPVPSRSTPTPTCSTARWSPSREPDSPTTASPASSSARRPWASTAATRRRWTSSGHDGRHVLRASSGWTRSSTPRPATSTAAPTSPAAGLSPTTDYSLASAGKVDTVFDPVGPLEPPPTVAVDPATDLVDGQVVQVTGSDFRPDEYVTLAQCPEGEDGALRGVRELLRRSGRMPTATSTCRTRSRPLLDAYYSYYGFASGRGLPAARSDRLPRGGLRARRRRRL